MVAISAQKCWFEAILDKHGLHKKDGGGAGTPLVKRGVFEAGHRVSKMSKMDMIIPRG